MSPARRAAFAGLIIVLALICYWPAIHGSFIWDDVDYVRDNPALKSFRGLSRIWMRPGATPQYYPLVFTSFWIELRAWGLETTGYHIVNVLLHAGSAILLWRLLDKLKVPGSMLAALIFAVHPVHVESVAWISERKNVLSGFLALSALSIWFDRDEPTTFQRVLALLLFFAALLSKSVVATLPAAILVIQWWKTGKLARRNFLDVVPMLVLGLMMIAWTATIERVHVGARGEEFALTFAQRLTICGRAVWFYLSKLVAPAHLTFSYPKWKIDASEGRWLLAAAAVPVLLIILWSARRRIGRGPAAAAMIYVGVLFPALGFANVFPFRYSFVADHFQYHASIAVITAVACLLWRRAKWLGAPIVLLLGALTWRQCAFYQSEESIWRQVLTVNPNSWLAKCNLSNILESRADLRGAEQLLRESIEIAPTAPEPLTSLAIILLRRGEFEEALQLSRRAVENEPTSHVAQYALASCYARLGDDRAAIYHYDEAIGCKPDQPAYYNELGEALLRVGNKDRALRAFVSALSLDPWIVSANFNAGKLYAEKGYRDPAIVYLRRALEKSPNYPEAYEELRKLGDNQP